MSDLVDAVLDACAQLTRQYGPAPESVKCLDCDYRIYWREYGWSDMLIYGRCLQCHCRAAQTVGRV